jgi:hypothetical protein
MVLICGLSGRDDGLTPFQVMLLSHLAVLLPIQVSQELVDAVHSRFYAALEAMWAKHQPHFPEYADVKLVMV